MLLLSNNTYISLRFPYKIRLTSQLTLEKFCSSMSISKESFNNSNHFGSSCLFNELHAHKGINVENFQYPYYNYNISLRKKWSNELDERKRQDSSLVVWQICTLRHWYGVSVPGDTAGVSLYPYNWHQLIR